MMLRSLCRKCLNHYQTCPLPINNTRYKACQFQCTTIYDIKRCIVFILHRCWILTTPSPWTPFQRYIYVIIISEDYFIMRGQQLWLMLYTLS